MAFGLGVAPDWSIFTYADFPWALPDQLFQSVESQLQQNKGPAFEASTTWGNVVTKADSYGLQTPPAVLGVTLFWTYVKKYAPEAETFLRAHLVVTATVAAIYLALVGQAANAKWDNAATKQRFSIDRERRNYDNMLLGH